MESEIAVLEGVKISPSDGSNYGGGSNYPDVDGWLRLPSTIGLADADLEREYHAKFGGCGACEGMAMVQKTISPSDGMYSGGSSHAPGMPLLPSNAGLATGSVMVHRTVAPSDGMYSGGSSHAPGMPLLPSNAGLAALAIQRTIAPSDGMYSGGSSYAPSMPLLPSNAGLAELSRYDVLDAVPAAPFLRKLPPAQRPVFNQAASAERILQLIDRARVLSAGYRQVGPAKKMAIQSELIKVGSELARIRGLRLSIAAR